MRMLHVMSPRRTPSRRRFVKTTAESLHSTRHPAADTPRPAPGTRSLRAEAREPLLKRLDQIFGAQTFHHLGLRQLVSQALTLRIADDGRRLQEDGGEVRSRKKQQQVPPH